VPLNDSLAAQVQNAVTTTIAFQMMTMNSGPGQFSIDDLGTNFGLGQFSIDDLDTIVGINETAFPELVKRFLDLPISIADTSCTWRELLAVAQKANCKIALEDLPFVQFLSSEVRGSNGLTWGDSIRASLNSDEGEGEASSIDLNGLFSKYFPFQPLDVLEVLLCCGVPLADLAISTCDISAADLAVA
jgi:hypothetical protein